MNKIIIILTLIIVVVAGCIAAPEANPTAAPTSKPTVVNLFNMDPVEESEADADVMQSTAQPTVAGFFNQSSAVTPMPTPAARALISSGVENGSLSLNESENNVEAVGEIVIYDDLLDGNWALQNSEDVDFDIQDTTNWFTVMDERLGLDSGAMSIAVEPQADLATLFFTVNEDSDIRYPREQILAVSLWLNSGLRVLETGDLAIAVVGSNDNTFWTENDFSVFQEPNESFSETRLYYLDINRAIPPETWVNVIVWLDDLQFDPDYANVTGVYIKNDVGFRSTYYVERVSLLTAQ